MTIDQGKEGEKINIEEEDEKGFKELITIFRTP